MRGHFRRIDVIAPHRVGAIIIVELCIPQGVGLVV